PHKEPPRLRRRLLHPAPAPGATGNSAQRQHDCAQRDDRAETHTPGTASAREGALFGRTACLGFRPRLPQCSVFCLEPLVCLPQSTVTEPAPLYTCHIWYDTPGMPIDSHAH